MKRTDIHINTDETKMSRDELIDAIRKCHKREEAIVAFMNKLIRIDLFPPLQTPQEPIKGSAVPLVAQKIAPNAQSIEMIARLKQEYVELKEQLGLPT